MLCRPLQQPYDGPFKVLQRKDKVFFLDINGKRVSVSIDRCKPAFFLNTEDFQLPQTKNETPILLWNLMQQLQHLLLWNLIQQLQRLPAIYVLVAKFIFQLGIVDTGRGFLTTNSSRVSLHCLHEKLGLSFLPLKPSCLALPTSSFHVHQSGLTDQSRPLNVKAQIQQYGTEERLAFQFPMMFSFVLFECAVKTVWDTIAFGRVCRTLPYTNFVNHVFRLSPAENLFFSWHLIELFQRWLGRRIMRIIYEEGIPFLLRKGI
ncbi:hypothetical protein TNCV_697251 [Trichonephila clavipes]|nr:hypothetical protein TNCV_697251 [Trichonephila clavipes]